MKYIRLKQFVFVLAVVCLTACSTQKVQQLRSKRFGDQTVMQGFNVRSSTRSVMLGRQVNGVQVDTAALAELNSMLREQGRIKNQKFVLTPYSEFGITLANQFKDKLKQLGVLSNRITVLPLDQKTLPSDNEGLAELEVISIAMVVDAPDCQLANTDSDAWTTDPYLALTNLGCANKVNLAKMVSNPLDLVRLKTLDSANGFQAESSVKRYQEGDTKEFIDIDFSDD